MREITDEMIEAAARVLNPIAMRSEPYTVGCGAPWHFEPHSFHSSCPHCSNNQWQSKTSLAQEKNKDQDRARERARKILRAAFEVEENRISEKI